MTHNITICRNYEPLSLIIRATITRNYDDPGSFLGQGEWLVDLDSVTDEQGRPVELTEDEQDEVIDRIVR